MTVTYADPAGALCSYLSVTVGDLLDTVTFPNGSSPQPAIFRPSLPEWFDKDMAATCIVVRPVKGPSMFRGGPLQVTDAVLGVTCFGQAEQPAAAVANAVTVNLRQMWQYKQTEWDGVKLYWANIAGGPIPLPDQQTLWPAVWLSTQVMYAEIAAS